jgi:hypothetical protein
VFLSGFTRRHTTARAAMDSNGDSILEKLDSIAPLKQFDAFPKLPNTYRSRTSYGGFMTIGVLALCILLVLNDLAEFLWGWPDYEFDVDKDVARTMAINVDLVVAMPCHGVSMRRFVPRPLFQSQPPL